MKRIFALLCAFALFFTIALPVYAEEDYDELREQIQQAAISLERLDVSEYDMNMEELLVIYEDLFHRGLLPWYADTYFDWTASPDGTLSSIVIRDLRMRSFDEELYMRKMAELIAKTCHEGMTQAQMVLSVHDYIVSRTVYSLYRGTNNNGYHALVLQDTACYGYAQLFLRVMQELGIPCQIVTSDGTQDSAGHAWNVVQLNGSWYHLDLTWDDPYPATDGKVLHDYFLKPDMIFRMDGHTYPWNSKVECVELSLPMDPVWQDSNSPVVFPDGERMIYRKDDGDVYGICATDLNTGEERLLITMDREPVLLGNAYYSCESVGLSCRGDRIWFNTPDTVYSMDMEGGDLREEYRRDTQETEDFIYSFYADEDKMVMSLLRTDDEIRTETLELDSADCHIHSYDSDYVDATCLDDGYTQYFCSCGVTYCVPGTTALGHGFEEGEQCIRCGFEPETESTESSTEPEAETAPTKEPGPESTSKPASGLWIGGTAAIGAVAALILGRKRKKSV